MLQVFLESSCSRVFGVVVLQCELYSRFRVVWPHCVRGGRRSHWRPANGKKRPFNITEGPNQKRKPKIATPSTTNKTNCVHCDKPGHTIDEWWRKASACLRCGNRNHRISKCSVLKEKEKNPNGQKKQGKLQAVQEMETMEEGGVVE
ncbi:hypothetical protein Taro_050374, partial [Colocasia esculenta]|nr:hypothetical protein [Colocasia esculenta]